MRKEDKKTQNFFSHAAGGGGLAKSLRAGDPRIPPSKMAFIQNEEKKRWDEQEGLLPFSQKK